MRPSSQVWNAYNEYRRGKEMVIVEGSVVAGVGNPLELSGRLAAELVRRRGGLRGKGAACQRARLPCRSALLAAANKDASNRAALARRPAGRAPPC